LFLNVMPSKEDEPNGTSLISERPRLARALKDVAAMHKQFLPYFVEGNALGESVLGQTTKAFVRAYRLRDRLLVLVLNDSAEPQHVAFRSDLSLWLPKSSDFEVKYFDEQGKLLRDSSVVGASWLAVTDVLQPEAISAFEVQAK
jgi:hypothetical protein